MLAHVFQMFGDVAQLGERGVRNAEARGSIPLISTKTGKGGGRFENKVPAPLFYARPFLPAIPTSGPLAVRMLSLGPRLRDQSANSFAKPHRLRFFQFPRCQA